jgi:predicted nucleic acid-binding protein
VTVVWDTTVLIDILHGSPAARSYAESLEELPICSEITRVEVLRGVRNAERAATERLLGRWDGRHSMKRSPGERESSGAGTVPAIWA